MTENSKTRTHEERLRSANERMAASAPDARDGRGTGTEGSARRSSRPPKTEC